jgi:hypothetical protein
MLRPLIFLSALIAPLIGDAAVTRIEPAIGTADVLGEPVQLGPGQKRLAVVYFMSERAKDESARLARAVDEQLLNAPMDTIGIVDVRKYGGIFRSLASSRMRKAEWESRDHRRTLRLGLGIDASPEVVNRWHLLGDFDGKLFDRFSVEKNPARPVSFVLDKSGAVHGPYRDTNDLLSALSRLLNS